jgi:DNA-binding FadR family transcriptional regulator
MAGIPTGPNAADTTTAAASIADPRGESVERVSDRVATQLLDRIARGELVPGQRLPGERTLAEQLKVSRVSVRAALQRLKTQGFLMAVQGGGTRVVSSAGAMDDALTEMVRFKLDNVLDLLDIRMALESWAARRAAERARPQDLATMRRTLDAMEPQPQSSRRVAESDIDFHMALAQAAGSPVYMHIFSTIRDILQHMVTFHHSNLFAAGQEALMLDQHRLIFAAIEARDPDRAAAAVTVHLGWVLERYQAIGLTLPESSPDRFSPVSR